MEENRGKVEKLNDSLYSRNYKEMEEKRSSLSADQSEVKEGWEGASLDSMLEERRKPERKPSGIKKFFLFSLIFFGAAALLAAYVYLGGSNFISTKNVDIQVTGPVSIPAGNDLLLSATVINKNNAELDSASLSVQYPEGTRDPRDSSKALTRDRVDLDNIKAGSEETHDFHAILFGEQGQIKQIKFTISYKVKGSNATFYKDKIYQISIGDTPVALGITQPGTVTSGEAFDTSVTLAANTSEVIKNVILHVEYPYGFTLVSSTPSANADNIWTLGDLAPGEEKVITLHGSIIGEDQEERTFRFYAGVADPASPLSLKSPLISTSETLSIARPSVGLSLSLNGNTEPQYIALPGHPISAIIRYKNNSKERLTNARLVVNLSGAALDKFSITSQGNGFYDSSSGNITWQAPENPALGEILPGGEGEVTFSFQALGNLPPGTSQAINISAALSGLNSSQVSLVSKLVREVKISSNVSLSGKSLFSIGPFKNSGPVPPKAEKDTTYTLVLALGNNLNDLTGVSITGKLGANVKFVTFATSSEVASYDSVNNTITWKAGAVSVGTGFNSASRAIYLQVLLHPSIGQIGTAPVLLSGVTLTGTDNFTHAAITASAPNITTRITTDPSYIQGDETVVK